MLKRYMVLKGNPIQRKADFPMKKTHRLSKKRQKPAKLPQNVLQQKTIPPELLLEAVELHHGGNLEGAENVYCKLIATYPKDPMPLHLLGMVKAHQGHYEESLALIDKAITLSPNYAHAHNDRGLTLLKLGEYDKALASFEKTVAINPEHAQALMSIGIIKLVHGNYEDGWKRYEWRWKSEGRADVRIFQKPLWLGKEPLQGKTLLLHAEQGLGDAIQQCRYIPYFKALGATIILGIPASLSEVISTLNAPFHIITEGVPLPDFDFHCPLMSLPLAMGTTIYTIPNTIPYLFTDPLKQKIWQARLREKAKPRIGLVWSGATAHKNDHNRSMALSLLAPLLEHDFEFHAIQKEVREQDREFLTKCKIILHAEDLKDFSDTAALMSEMDLIISVDTSVAHLAGALGKPVWILLPFVPDFRWMLERKDSPWYPTARLFRQPRIGDWESVIAKVASELISQFDLATLSQ